MDDDIENEDHADDGEPTKIGEGFRLDPLNYLTNCNLRSHLL